MAKKKKEKVIWYDDNSTISDMSNVGRRGQGSQAPKSNTEKPSSLRTVKNYSTFKDKWKTYWQTVKMMIMPTMVALFIILLLYLLMLWITSAAA